MASYVVPLSCRVLDFLTTRQPQTKPRMDMNRDPGCAESLESPTLRLELKSSLLKGGVHIRDFIGECYPKP